MSNKTRTLTFEISRDELMHKALSETKKHMDEIEILVGIFNRTVKESTTINKNYRMVLLYATSLNIRCVYTSQQCTDDIITFCFSLDPNEWVDNKYEPSLTASTSCHESIKFIGDCFDIYKNIYSQFPSIYPKKASQ